MSEFTNEINRLFSRIDDSAYTATTPPSSSFISSSSPETSPESYPDVMRELFPQPLRSPARPDRSPALPQQSLLRVGDNYHSDYLSSVSDFEISLPPSLYEQPTARRKISLETRFDDIEKLQQTPPNANSREREFGVRNYEQYELFPSDNRNEFQQMQNHTPPKVDFKSNLDLSLKYGLSNNKPKFSNDTMSNDNMSKENSPNQQIHRNADRKFQLPLDSSAEWQQMCDATARFDRMSKNNSGYDNQRVYDDRYDKMAFDYQFDTSYDDRYDRKAFDNQNDRMIRDNRFDRRTSNNCYEKIAFDNQYNRTTPDNRYDRMTKDTSRYGRMVDVNFPRFYQNDEYSPRYWQTPNDAMRFETMSNDTSMFDAVSQDTLTFDAMSRDSMFDAMSRDSMFDAMSRDSMFDAMSRDTRFDAMSHDTRFDAMSHDTWFDAMPNDTMFDAMPNDVFIDSSRYGMSGNYSEMVSPIISPVSRCRSNSTFSQAIVPFKEPIVTPSNSMRKGNKLCTFCRKNGETPLVYMTHKLKERVKNRIVVTCPILRSHICSSCGATGDDSHTISYCPLLRNSNGKPIPATTVSLKSTRFKSNGMERRKYNSN